MIHVDRFCVEGANVCIHNDSIARTAQCDTFATECESLVRNAFSHALSHTLVASHVHNALVMTCGKAVTGATTPIRCWAHARRCTVMATRRTARTSARRRRQWIAKM